MNTTRTYSPLWQLFSYVFHPLFIPLFIYGTLIYLTPVFGIVTYSQANNLMLNVLVNLVFFQGFTVFLLYKLKFINSIYLHTAKERIVPIFSYTVYTFWLWAFVLVKNPIQYPKVATAVAFVLFAVSATTLIINSFIKVSLHLIGMGMLVAISIIITTFYHHTIAYILWALIATLAVLLARLQGSNHTRTELIVGFILGFLPMLVIPYFFSK